MNKFSKYAEEDGSGYGSIPVADPSTGQVVDTSMGAAPSMWSKLGGYGDVAASLAGKYADYEHQMAQNRSQDYINQAAAKWSGFQPGLMNLVKPLNAPNPVAMAAEAAVTAPKYWYDVSKLYDASKAAKNGDDSQMEKLKAQDMQKQALAVAGK